MLGSNAEHKPTKYPSRIRLESLDRTPRKSVEEVKFTQNNRFEESKYAPDSSQNSVSTTPRVEESLSRKSLISECINQLNDPITPIKMHSIEFDKKDIKDGVLELASFAVKQKRGYAAHLKDYSDPKGKELRLSKIMNFQKVELLRFELMDATPLSVKIF